MVPSYLPSICSHFGVYLVSYWNSEKCTKFCTVHNSEIKRVFSAISHDCSIMIQIMKEKWSVSLWPHEICMCPFPPRWPWCRGMCACVRAHRNALLGSTHERSLVCGFCRKERILQLPYFTITRHIPGCPRPRNPLRLHTPVHTHSQTFKTKLLHKTHTCKKKTNILYVLWWKKIGY